MTKVISFKDLCLQADNHLDDEEIMVYDFDRKQFYESQNKKYDFDEEED